MRPHLDRRAFLLGGAALAMNACRKKSSPAPSMTVPVLSSASAPPPRGGAWREVSFDATPDTPEGERAFLLSPWPASDALGDASDASIAAAGTADVAARPLLVALHGRGEAGRGLDVGAAAWPNEYQLDRLHRRLYAPPLTSGDLLDMTSPERLDKLNASLSSVGYDGLGLACPYTPNLSDRSVEGAQGFARFVIGTLLPRLRDETGSKADRRAIGIDGVSMGGRLALFVGLTHPEVFGVVGALQPAISVEEAPLISDLARSAMAKAKVILRLVTSEEDYFLPAVRAASARLHADGVEHELVVIPGTHGYEFNRGPGGADMLVWHERVQRGLPPP